MEGESGDAETGKLTWSGKSDESGGDRWGSWRMRLRRQSEPWSECRKWTWTVTHLLSCGSEERTVTTIDPSPTQLIFSRGYWRTEVMQGALTRNVWMRRKDPRPEIRPRDLLGRDWDKTWDAQVRDRDETEAFSTLSETRPRRDVSTSPDGLETEMSRRRPHPWKWLGVCLTFLSGVNMLLIFYSVIVRLILIQIIWHFSSCNLLKILTCTW